MISPSGGRGGDCGPAVQVGDDAFEGSTEAARAPAGGSGGGGGRLRGAGRAARHGGDNGDTASGKWLSAERQGDLELLSTILVDLDDEMQSSSTAPHQVTAAGTVEGSVIGNADAERVVLRVRQKLEGVEVRH